MRKKSPPLHSPLPLIVPRSGAAPRVIRGCSFAVPLIAPTPLPRAAQFRCACAYWQPSAPSRFRDIASQRFPAKMHTFSRFYCLLVLPGERKFGRKFSLTDCLQTPFCKPAKISELFMVFEFGIFTCSILFGRLAHGGILPRRRFQPVGGRVEYGIILPEDIFAQRTISRSATACFGSF
jgi:hypothetical protein